MLSFVGSLTVRYSFSNKTTGHNPNDFVFSLCNKLFINSSN